MVTDCDGCGEVAHVDNNKFCRKCATETRVAECDNHGIKVDGEFHVLCRDKDGTFHAGAPGLPSNKPHNLADAVAITKHMAGLGYKPTNNMPGLLLPGEMVIIRKPPEMMPE